MAKTVLVPIADGTEEIEAVTIVDVLRRAGIQVTVASVNGLQVTASRGVRLIADKLIKDCANDSFDLIALPGGMPGAEHLRDCAVLTHMLRAQQQADKLYAAICASPAVVLAVHKLLDGKRATCYPAMQGQLPYQDAADQRIVIDGNCITSQGPATAMGFALELIRQLLGDQKAEQIAAALLMKPGA